MPPSFFPIAAEIVMPPQYRGERYVHSMLGDLTFARDCFNAEVAYWAERGVVWPFPEGTRVVYPEPIDTGLPPWRMGE